MSFTFIDLFSGIGGFHIALSNNGGKCVFACDIDKECIKVYEKNYGLKPSGDIRNIEAKDIPDHDILVGGFPCQAHSNAGHKKAFDDQRGRLFDEIIRIAKEKRPKIMLLENVKHIKKVKDGQVYRYIYKQLDNIGYHVSDIEFSPHEFGIPQLRPRVYFICLRKDIYDDIEFEFEPEETTHNIFQKKDEVDDKYKVSRELEKVIDIWNIMLKKMEKGQSLSVPILLEEFYKDYTEKELEEMADWRRTYIKKNKELYEKYKKEWDTWYQKHKELLSKKAIYSKLEWQTGVLKGDDSIWDHFIQVRQSGIRVKRNNYFPTLVAIVQVPIYGKQKRYLTPRECARLQSFPDTFVLHENDKITYKQLGNSVNVEVVEFVMKTVLDTVGFFKVPSKT
jgi:DNA (cytosine-5)-methyltransferase 1